MDTETARNIAERRAINRLQESLYNEILPFVVWKDVPECKERILAALVEFQEQLEAIPINQDKLMIKPQDCRLLRIKAHVRYWEDATVNSEEDTAGTLIPFRNGDAWEPTIDIVDGQIQGWPTGVTADIHYKVCDAGEYWLMRDGLFVAKWRDDYVPRFLYAGDLGYGDYIIMSVGADGKIKNWQKPVIIDSEWLLVPTE